MARTALVLLLGLAAPLATGAVPASTAPAFLSDDFNAANLNTSVWTFADPRGDSSITFENSEDGNGRLAITAPTGTSHDAWVDGNFAPRIMQAARDIDFGIEVKFDSQPSATYQMQGVIVQQGDLDFLRFDVYSMGPMTKIFAASISAGVASVKTESFIIAGSPLYMRIERSGAQWAQLYSYDGTNWITSVEFTHTIAVSAVGVFVGNNPASAPGFTGTVDYFFNTALRVDPEDGALLADTTSPLIYHASDEPQEESLRITWATDEAASGVVEYGLSSLYGSGTVSQTGYGTTHDLMIPQLDPDTVFHYRIRTSDANGNETVSRDYVTRTAPVALGFPVVNVWYGSQQVFGNIGRPQRWVDIPGNVSGTNTITSLSYRLNGGAVQALSMGPNTRRLARSGDFNVEIDFANLAPGLNHVVITATDSLSQSTVRTIDIDNQMGNTWPGTYTVDWANVSDLQDAVQVVDGLWGLEPHSIRIVQVGYDRLIDIGERTWTDYEVTVPITMHSVDPAGYAFPSNGPLVGIIMRWNGHTDYLGGQPRNGYLPYGAAGCYLFQNTGAGDRLFMFGNNDLTMAEDLSGRHLQLGVTYNFKLRVQSVQGQGALYSFKVWNAAQSEPVAWDLTGQGLAGDPQQGSFLLNAHHVDASFGNVTVVPVSDTIPPVLSSISAAPLDNEATITWTTNEAATSRVAFGTTTGYGGGIVADSALVTPHSILITGLTPQTLYHYQVSSTDASGNVSVATDRTFTTGAAPPPSTIVSDDFSAFSLNSGLWTFINPLGDGTLTMTGIQARIAVPAGVSHDTWTGGNFAPRLMQTANNTDFEIEAKFESVPTVRNQQQGLLVEAGGGNFIRFDFIHDPSTVRLFAATFTGGSPTVRVNNAIAGGNPIFIRVKRKGNRWTESYSYDGSSWTSAANFTFTLAVSSVGVWAANAGDTPPAYAGFVDYFFNNASRIDPEDGAAIPAAVTTLQVHDDGPDIVLDWTAVPRATSYKVFVSASPSLPRESWTLLTEVPGTTYRNVGAAGGPSRYYSVVGNSSAGMGAW